jgi:pyruvate kinase
MKIIRDLNDEYGYTTAILETYKDQTSRRCNEWRVIVHDGDLITFTTAEDILGTAQKCSWNIKLSKWCKYWWKILLDDGKLIFEIVETDKNTSSCYRVIQGGEWSLKRSTCLIQNITSSDDRKRHCWCYFAIEQKVDWITFFCKTPQDLKDLQNLIAEHSDYKIPIIAKIEMPEALENIDKIVAYCDGLMVARGDLGWTSCTWSTFSSKELIRKAKMAIFQLLSLPKWWRQWLPV